MATFDADKGQWARGDAITSLTDNSGGTASDTIADLSAEAAAVQNAVASLAAKVEAILDHLRDSGSIDSA